jgi:hypothetical protein
MRRSRTLALFALQLRLGNSKWLASGSALHHTSELWSISQ